MSRACLSLPFRTLAQARPGTSQWICRRCLATATHTEGQFNTTIEKTGIRAVSSPPVEMGAYDPSLPASQRIGPDGKPYRLRRSDFLLKKPLIAHPIPVAHLQHSTSDLLPESEKAQRDQVEKHKRLVGVVVSSGKMDKTVRVRVGGQTWNKRIGKMFHSHENFLVHDPNNSLITGDVIEMHRLHVSRRVAHVVASIVSPFSTPIEARPPIPTPDERLAAYKEKRFAKLKRRALRKEAADGDAAAIETLEQSELDPGAGVGPGIGRMDNVQKQVGKSRNPGKGAILGNKGQKLPTGVLPGGQHEVGKIHDRAMHNKQAAMKRDAQTESNLLESREKSEELERKNLGAGSVVS